MNSEVSGAGALLPPVVPERLKLVLATGMACGRSTFGPQIEALSGIADIFVVDYGLARSMTEMAERVLSQTSGPVSVAGHSMGGRVALEMYRLAPRRVEKLCLIGTEYRPRPEGQAGEAETAKRNGLLEIARTRGMRAMGQAWMSALIAPERQADTKLVEAILDNFEQYGPEIVEAQIAAGHARPDHSALLPQIRCPVLLIAGRKDVMRPAWVHENMNELIPGSRLVIVERCGHMPAMEFPEVVSAAMRSWLQGSVEDSPESGISSAGYSSDGQTM